MGEDKWTTREPGSIAGSYVPPPVVPEESSGRPPLPRRKPQAQIRSVSRSSGCEPAPESAWRASGSANSGQRGLEFIQSEVTAPPQLPDNVRYLFKPVLTQTTPVAEPVDSERDWQRRAAGEPAGTPTSGRRPIATEWRAGTGHEIRTSAANAAALAADQAAVANLRPGPGPDRREHRRPGQPAPEQRRTGPRRRLTWAAAVLLIAATAIGTAFILIKREPSAHRTPQASAGPHQQQTRGGNGQTGAKAFKGLSSAAIIRGQAARWIAREIGKNMIIACDDVMCGDLVNDGVAASNLLVLGATAPDPLGADIVVGTPALRSQFGARLATEYAPTVIASFGTGTSRVDVRVVASDGAAAYELAASNDLAARQRNGSTLLRNSGIHVAAAARPDLIAGLVDSRLLMMLPVLASQHPIQILGFYDRAPRSAQGVPLTGVELAGADSASGLTAGSYLRWLLGFLRGQRAPFRPASVTTGRIHGHEVVRVRFARPSPVGLFNGAISGGNYAY
jgi:hypothetical protein